MDPITIATLIGAGSMAGNTLMNKFIPGGDNGMQIPAQSSPNLGETLMSRGGAMPSVNQMYPKPFQQQEQQGQQNGSLLGNSLIYNPMNYMNPYGMRGRYG